MNISSIDRFFLEIFKANKQFVAETWEKWQDYTAETLKADVEKSYPDGFKDFLIEKIEEEIKKNSPKPKVVKETAK